MERFNSIIEEVYKTVKNIKNIIDAIRYEYWTYYDNFCDVDTKTFERLVKKCKKVCKPTTGTIYGKTYVTKRVCCMYVPNIEEAREKSKNDKNFNYTETPLYEWCDAPKVVSDLREKIQQMSGEEIDYVLVNYYRGCTEFGVGQDYIGWHNDEEALDSSVFSVSLGATRKFQFRLIDSKDVTVEYILNNGDMLHMKGPSGKRVSCQRKYKHRVPQMNMKDLVKYAVKNNIEIPPGRKTIKNTSQAIINSEHSPDRVNLTFRTFE